jgi:orotate phosphoribosyltransferase
MVEAGALLFGDFTLKSGRKSPYFINTGEYKTGEQLSRLGDFYAELIQNSLNETEGLKIDALFGPAYKGIPLAAVTAVKLSSRGLNPNVSFNRKEIKEHGEGNIILGYVPKDGDRVAIVEDVTTAGTSVREVVSLMEKLGVRAKITALYISIDRMERGTGVLSATEQIKSDYGIGVYSVASAWDIIDYLENSPISDAPANAARMREYLNEYGLRIK